MVNNMVERLHALARVVLTLNACECEMGLGEIFSSVFVL